MSSSTDFIVRLRSAVLAQKCAPIPELKKFITAQHHIVDVNGWADLKELPSKYEGFCW